MHMNSKLQHLEGQIRARIARYRRQSKKWYHTYRWKALLAALAFGLLSSKNLELTISINGQTQARVATFQKGAEPPESLAGVPTSLPDNMPGGKAVAVNRHEPPFAEEYAPRVPVYKQKGSDKQVAYIERFAQLAQEEMRRYGIPASITLAQGMLESNLGSSKLASGHHNHFGIKCREKSCPKGHCVNYADDSHKDFFRSFGTAWESYRAHSLLLVERSWYAPLFQLLPSDYKGWAKGLQKAGYATDPGYADKLIRLIESLELHRYDDTM
jgi:hypothetical protein